MDYVTKLVIQVFFFRWKTAFSDQIIEIYNLFNNS